VNLTLHEKSDAPRLGEKVLVSHGKLEPLERQFRPGGGSGIVHRTSTSRVALLFVYVYLYIKSFFPFCPFIIVILMTAEILYYFSRVFLAKNASENHFHFESPKLS